MMGRDPRRRLQKPATPFSLDPGKDPKAVAELGIELCAGTAVQRNCPDPLCASSFPRALGGSKKN